MKRIQSVADFDRQWLPNRSHEKNCNNKKCDICGLRRWIYQTAIRNHWRVCHYIELEDLVQEGMMAYTICRSRYRQKIKNNAHFMALVKVVYLNQITDLANKRTKGDCIPISEVASPGREWEALELLAGVTDGDAEMQATIGKACAQITAFLKLFDSSEGLARLNAPCRKYKSGHKETPAEKIGRIIGMKPIDFEFELRALLGVEV